MISEPVTRNSARHAWRRRVSLKHIFPLIAVLGLVSGSATAQVPSVIGSIIPLEQVNDLKYQPLALLAKFPEAGVRMARYVAQVISSHPSLVDSILSIMNDTSPEQASAIGAGMVRAARSMHAKNPETSRWISDKVMKSNNLWLTTTYEAIGPRYRPGTTPLPLLTPYNPDGLANQDIGSSLAVDKSRVGPALKGENGPFERDEERRNPLEAGQGVEGQIPHGTIVAWFDSDAGHNGAVSTSPTH